MKSNWPILVLMLIVASLPACAPTIQPRPLSGDLAKTQNYLGLFEITPPQGSDWYEMQRIRGRIVYGKKLESPNHTFIASMSVYDASKKFSSENDFLIFIRNARAKDNNPDRFNMLLHDENLDKTKGPFCTKFHQKAEDKVASKSSGFLSILEIKGFSCLHPQKQNIVTVDYSERSASPFQDAALIAEGERFINSLEIK